MLFPAILTAKQKGSNQIILNDNRRGEMAGYVSKRIAHKKVFNVKKNHYDDFFQYLFVYFCLRVTNSFFLYEFTMQMYERILTRATYSS